MKAKLKEAFTSLVRLAHFRGIPKTATQKQVKPAPAKYKEPGHSLRFAVNKPPVTLKPTAPKRIASAVPVDDDMAAQRRERARCLAIWNATEGMPNRAATAANVMQTTMTTGDAVGLLGRIRERLAATARR